ncbi:MAG: pitrilysin family protein [bacterium]|nr:pitrilysin family protein [bacterium]
MSHSQATLKTVENLSVLRIPMPAVSSVTALILANTGSRYEGKEEQGIAHFFEHMVFKGTKSYPSAQELSSAIDTLGADFNAFTSKEYTGYYIKAASRHLPVALTALSEMLLSPLLKEEDIEREKGVIIEEMNMYHDTPMQYVSMLFDRLVFPDAGLGHDILGTKEVIRAMTREQFVSFLNRWYGQGNLLLVLAGDATALAEAKLEAQIERLFGGQATERATGKQDLSEYLTERTLQPNRLHVENRKTEQAHLILGWPGLSRSNKQKHILTVLTTVMGGSMSSRLFSEVREKRGLCYYVRADVDFYHDTGIVGASAGVDPGRVEEALEVILAEFKDLSSGKRAVTAEELTRAKEHLLGTMTLSLEDSHSVAQFYGMRQLLQGELESPEQVQAKLQSVTLEQVNNLAQELYHSGEQRLALIGPFPDKAVFERFLT